MATSSESTARIGVIGAGTRICQILDPLLVFFPGARVTAVYDPDDTALARFVLRLAQEMQELFAAMEDQE